MKIGPVHPEIIWLNKSLKKRKK